MDSKTNIIVSLILLFLSAVWCSAQENNNDTPSLQEMQKQILEMQKQLQTMQQQHNQEMQNLKQEHQKEIDALKDRIKTLQPAPEPKASEKDESAYLRELANKLAGAPEEEKKPEETVFKFRGLSLQKLNPELSVTGDMLGYYKHQAGTRKRSDFIFRGLGLHFESYLDPYSKFKAAVPINEDGAELGEAYFTRFAVLDGVNLTLGKFRQQFGIVNRWHKHALDQVDFPLALRKIFGEGGLNQIGASVDWTLPTRSDAAQEITLQITNTNNDRLFGRDTQGNPCLLAHYKNYRDLSESTYLEFGLTGLFGWNDEWDVDSHKEHDTLGAQVFGADCTVTWEPVERMRYRNIEWRSEIYVLNQDLLAPDDSGRDNLNAWGAYSYVQTKISRTVDIGFRGDYYQPDTKDYAEMPGTAITPLAYSTTNAFRWQVAPYITWHQSPFVKFRCEYDHADGRGMEKHEDLLWLQMIFAAGPHKHERY